MGKVGRREGLHNPGINGRGHHVPPKKGRAKEGESPDRDCVKVEIM